MFKKALLLLLCGCAGLNIATSPRQKFIDKHYADVAAAREDLEKTSALENLKLVNTLRKMGIFDENEPDPSKIMGKYLAETKAAKEKRIAEIKKSTAKYEHSKQDIENAIILCAVVAAEMWTPTAIKNAGDAFFEDEGNNVNRLLAINDALCSCTITKYAPRFTPQTLKDYAVYMRSGKFIITKDKALQELTGEEHPLSGRLIFDRIAKPYNALGNDKKRLTDAIVFDWFATTEDEKCVNELSNVIKKGKDDVVKE